MKGAEAHGCPLSLTAREMEAVEKVAVLRGYEAAMAAMMRIKGISP